MHTEMAEPPSEPQSLSGSVCRAMHFYGIGVFLVSFLISFVAILVRLGLVQPLGGTRGWEIMESWNGLGWEAS